MHVPQCASASHHQCHCKVLLLTLLAAPSPPNQTIGLPSPSLTTCLLLPQPCPAVRPPCIHHTLVLLRFSVLLWLCFVAGYCAGLMQLQHLSLGWCPSLGDARSDPTNNIHCLALLTGLTHLNLGGTKVSDDQARQVLPALTQLQVMLVTDGGAEASCTTVAVQALHNPGWLNTEVLHL